MALTIANARRRKSGATGNNLGGAMHASELSNNIVNNIWRKIEETELQTGITIFRGFYIHNNHATDPIKNLILYFSVPVTNTGIEISLAQGTSALTAASVEPTIATETTTPTVLNNKWYITPTNRSDGLPISGDINAGAHAFVWMRMVVPSGTQTSVFTHYRMKAELFNPEAASNIPEDWGMIFAANMECIPDTVTAFTNITKRDFQFFQTCGNNSVSQSDVACFLEELREEGLRPKTKIALGYTDQSTTKKNALKTEFGIGGTDYYSYDVYNVHFTIMAYQSSYALNDTQYTWVKQDLQTARQRPGIDWLVVVVNDNMYTPYLDSGLTDPAPDAPNPSMVSVSLRDMYHPLFMANFVHVVLSGGANMYYKTHAIKYNAADPVRPILVQTDQNSSSGGLNGDNYTWFDKGLVDGASVFVSVGTIGITATSHTGTEAAPGTFSAGSMSGLGVIEPKKSYMVLQFSDFGNKMNILRYKHTIDELTGKSSITKVLPP